MNISGRIVRRLPAWVRLTPMDVMFAVMGLMSSVGSLLGITEPSSITRVLPEWGAVLWSVCLLVGCMAWLAGLTSVKENNGSFVLRRMPALLLGLYLVSLAAFAYGVVIMIFAGLAGVFPGLTLLAVAGGTYLRRVDFASRFREVDDE